MDDDMGAQRVQRGRSNEKYLRNLILQQVLFAFHSFLSLSTFFFDSLWS